MINRLVEAADQVEVQDTTFSTDVLGRYICNTWDEAVNNGGGGFGAVVIGAGMFGAYCAEKIYRNSLRRVLVLDAGGLLVTEHIQNLSRIGLNAAGATQVASNSQDPGTRARVWGSPWRSQVPFPGLAYCLGGRSLYWGGWAPRLTQADLLQWPAELTAYLQGGPGTDAAYDDVERETGVYDKTDYISGPLYQRLLAKFQAVMPAVATVDAIEEAPLAIQAAAPASGLFSFDKYSSAPILTDAIREAADSPDSERRLFFVPRAHVVKLHATGGAVTAIEAYYRGQHQLLAISPACAVVLANSAVETTRLALESFPTLLMGNNLMGHLRTNTTVRIKRAAIAPALPAELQAAALLVRGSTPQGRYHLQVTAAAVAGQNPEAVMFRMIPDVDLLDQILASQTADWIVITLRGIGEMEGNQNPTLPRQTGAVPSWIDLSFDQTDQYAKKRAWVNLVKTPNDDLLWTAMDNAAVALARKLANDDPGNIEYLYNGAWQTAPPPPGMGRDGLGTTHHEAGTLWMGSSPGNSVTDLNGRFHHVQNAFVAGPAVFPTLGSANPALTALALARRTALAISAAP
jgi:choline dehydrogenase-like flavoprotein